MDCWRLCWNKNYKIMITSFLFLIFAGLLAMLNFLLGKFVWQIPLNIETGIQNWLGALHNLNEILPFLTDIIQVGLLLTGIFIIKYTFEIVMWLFSKIPIIGSYSQLPGKTEYYSKTTTTAEGKPSRISIRQSRKRWM